MCAIFGIVGVSNLNLVKEISKIQIFRGPDHQGFYSDKNFLTIGNNRLAVIDAKNGNQPIFSSDKRYVIVYNGCIYNFNEIKDYLLSKNIKFFTNCDTEVIVNSFMYFGTKCFNYFDGMWSMAIYDTKEKKCFLSRDYIGQKPLYYSLQKDYLIFSSQLEGILVDKNISKEINNLSVKKFFSYSHIPAPQTLYKNIFQVEPGHYIEINANNFSVQKKIYWDLLNGPDNNLFFKNDINDKNFVKSFDKIIDNHFIADNKPVISLSGGIDSQIILKSLIKKHNLTTCTIGFENKSFDESKFVEEDRQNYNKKIYKPNKDEIFEHFNNLIKIIKEPIGDSSILPSYILFNHIKNFSNVSIGGDGGDESFFGYITFDAFYVANLLKKILPDFISNSLTRLTNFNITNNEYMSNKFKIKKFFQGINNEIKHLLPLWMSSLDRNSLEIYFDNDFSLSDVFSETNHIFDNDYDIMRKAQLYYYKLYLPMVLNKVDQASMYNSVENRSPFLSKKIINFSLTLDSKNLYSLFNKKKFIKKNYTQIINKKVLNRPKHGFALDKNIILNNEELVAANIDEKFLINKNFFKTKYKQYLSGQNEYGAYIWNEIIFNNIISKY